jgi:hypothetical protein
VSLEDDLRAHALGVVESAAEDMVGLLRAVVPVRSGHLLSTIEDPEVAESATAVTATVRATADYADDVDESGRSAGWFSAVVAEWDQFLIAAEVTA